APKTMNQAIVAPIKEFLSRKTAIAILVFIIIYKLADAFALALNTPFLLRGVGFDLATVGAVAKSVGVSATLIGSLIGGILMPSLGLYRSLMIFGFLQIASNLAYALLALVGKSFIAMVAAVFTEYFCGGLSTVAFIVFLTALCDRRFTATQYALFSAAMAVGRVFVGPEAAAMVDHMGWFLFYLSTFIIGIPSLILLWWLKSKLDFSAYKLIRYQIEDNTVQLTNAIVHYHHCNTLPVTARCDHVHASWLFLVESARRVRS
ncbi:unnamed protein product, partial [marine sediment metagenome]